MFHKSALLVALVTSLSPSASGALVSGDDTVFGASSITRDTVSNLEWLDWTLSTDISFDEMQLLFGVGGDFEGWRHATYDETVDLVEQFGFNVAFTPFPSGPGGRAPFGPLSAYDEFVSQLGETASPFVPLTAAIVNGTGGGPLVPDELIFFLIGPPAADASRASFEEYTEASVGGGLGHALVRSSNAIPEPGVFGASMAMSFVLGTRRRRTLRGE